MLQFVTIIFINKMHSNEQPNPRSRSLKDAIYQAITAHKVKSVASLLRNTHKRIHQHLQASQRSLLRSQYQSPIIQTHLSHNRYTPSPSSFAHSKSSTHRSPNYLQPKHCQRHKKEAKKGGTGKLGSRQKYIPNKMRMKNLKGKKLKKPLEASRGSELLTRSHDRSLGIQSRSKERGSSNMNLSSIVQQQSSESNLMTPCSKRSRFGKNQKRQFEGEQTHKKQKNGVKEVVWRRLERCIKEPQRFHSLLKSEMLGIRFRIIRKKIIQIQVLVQRQLISLSIFLQKGNLQCQSVHERFQNLKAGANFSLYSSVRAVDLDHALHLPKLQVEAVSSQELKFQKMITLPYCWLHFAEESLLPHASKSRIKTKVCIEEFLASKNQLKVLGGVLANWECKSPSRGEFVWSSRLLVAQEEFQLKFIQKDGNVAGEVAGRGEQRLTRMMQFLTALLS